MSRKNQIVIRRIYLLLRIRWMKVNGKLTEQRIQIEWWYLCMYMYKVTSEGFKKGGCIV